MASLMYRCMQASGMKDGSRARDHQSCESLAASSSQCATISNEKPQNEKTEEIIEGANTFHFDVMLKLINEGYKPHSTWYENMCRDMNLNRRIINQELECAFIGSGDKIGRAHV